DIVAAQQLFSHRLCDGSEQFSDPHDPTIQSRPRDLQARLSLLDCALPIERQVIQVFAYHRVDHYPIAGPTLLDNPWRQRRTPDSLFFTSFTGALLALSHPHEVLGRFDIELGRGLNANRTCWSHRGRLAVSL